MPDLPSFLPPYSTPVGGIPPSVTVDQAAFLNPPDKLTELTPRQGERSPPLFDTFGALCGGDTLEAISKGTAITVPEAELQDFPSKTPRSPAALLALLQAAPLLSFHTPPSEG